MNYYEHHLGDWAAATGHLTWDEDMAYTRLLRAYYHHERAIPEGQQYRLAKASTPSQRKAVDQVLAEFFQCEDGAYRQKRADAEIARFHAGEPEREAKKANEEARMKRHRDERARLFQVLSEAGQHAPWNVNMNELRDIAKRCGPPLPATAPATPATATHTQSLIPKQSAGEMVAGRHSPPPVVDVSEHEPTAAGLLCRAIKSAGVTDVNPGHPDLLRLMAARIPVETFTATAKSLAGRGKGRFALLLRTVEGQWGDAQASGQVAESKAVDPWATRGGVEGIAKTLGMPKWDECCTFDVYFGRVRKAFEDEQRGSA